MQFDKISKIILISGLAGFFEGISSIPSKAQMVYQCKPCPPGKYSSSSTNYKCKSCEEGYYSSVYGSSSCKKCEGNSYSSSGATACVSCNGKYGNDKKCLCPPGTWCDGGESLKCRDMFIEALENDIDPNRFVPILNYINSNSTKFTFGNLGGVLTAFNNVKYNILYNDIYSTFYAAESYDVAGMGGAGVANFNRQNTGSYFDPGISDPGKGNNLSDIAKENLRHAVPRGEASGGGSGSSGMELNKDKMLDTTISKLELDKIPTKPADVNLEDWLNKFKPGPDVTREDFSKFLESARKHNTTSTGSGKIEVNLNQLVDDFITSFFESALVFADDKEKQLSCIRLASNSHLDSITYGYSINRGRGGIDACQGVQDTFPNQYLDHKSFKLVLKYFIIDLIFAYSKHLENSSFMSGYYQEFKKKFLPNYDIIRKGGQNGAKVFIDEIKLFLSRSNLNNLEAAFIPIKNSKNKCFFNGHGGDDLFKKLLCDNKKVLKNVKGKRPPCGGTTL